jgi:hypothetical protein
MNMLIQPQKNLAPLALRDVVVPGRTEPALPSGAWGINCAAALLNFPGLGLRAQVPVWPNKKLGDKVKLLLNNEEVDQYTISDPTELEEPTTLWVAPGRWQDGPYTLTYEIKQIDQKEERPDHPLHLYVKLGIPGGQDTDPEPGHSNLAMTIPPGIVSGGVDKEIAENGFVITITPYPDIAEGDICIMSWGGIFVLSAPVTADQIRDPVNHPIEIAITKAIIELAGDTDSSGLAVTFKVRDIVGNESEDWCKETRIVVTIGISFFPACIVEQAHNNVLDLDKLGDENVKAQVWATAPQFRLKDIIHLKMRGTTAEGEFIEVAALPQTIDNIPHVYVLMLNNADVRKLAKTQVTFSYEIQRSGSTDPLRSKGQFVQVVGEARRLAAPIAEDEQQGALEPDLTQVRLRIPFDSLIVEGTAIELVWFGMRPDGSAYSPKLDWHFPDRDEVSDPEGFFIIVDGKHLKILEGGTLELWYHLLTDEDGEIVKRESAHASVLRVGAPQLELAEATVLGEEDGALEPKDLINGTSKVTCPNPVANPTKANDVVTWLLRDAAGVVMFEDDKTLNSLTAGRAVDFPLSAAFVQQYFEARRGEKLSVSYHILRFETGKTSYSDPLFFVVGQAPGIQLPVATFSEASGQQKDQINPDDVFPAGATVVIAATARLKTDDQVNVVVEGKTTFRKSHRVLATQADKELAVIKVDHTFIADNVDESIALSYTVTRQAGGTDGPSDPAVYDVRKVIGSGLLKVMGARYNRSTYRSSGSSHVLSAFNASTGQPLQAEWKYPDDSQWTTASTWYDTQPEQPLQVRTTDDALTLNAANIIGNGNETTTGPSAFVAHRDVGDVVGWGDDYWGATIPRSISTLDDIVEVSCTRSAYAGRRANSAVVVWGKADEGGSMTGVSPLDFKQVVGNLVAFAGLKLSGQVVAWGSTGQGGTVPEPISALSDVTQIIAARIGFAALRATGHVVAWGPEAYGGTVPGDIAGFTDIKALIGSFGAFAALRANGRIVGWGHANHGGVVPAPIASLTDIIELSSANHEAFVARRATGQVVAWGTAGHGGVIDRLIERLTDIVEVSSTKWAFAARRGNGRVVAWGGQSAGGLVPGNIATLDDIVQVCGSSNAFAALRKNGTVVAWGSATVGGDTTPVVDQLTSVVALYSNTSGFTALTSDGRVITWGEDSGGGDSSMVQDLLRGKLSYLANPVSRGLALKAHRQAMLKTHQ